MCEMDTGNIGGGVVPQLSTTVGMEGGATVKNAAAVLTPTALPIKDQISVGTGSQATTFAAPPPSGDAPVLAPPTMTGAQATATLQGQGAGGSNEWMNVSSVVGMFSSMLDVVMQQAETALQSGISQAETTQATYTEGMDSAKLTKDTAYAEAEKEKNVAMVNLTTGLAIIGTAAASYGVMAKQQSIAKQEGGEAQKIYDDPAFKANQKTMGDLETKYGKDGLRSGMNDKDIEDFKALKSTEINANNKLTPEQKQKEIVDFNKEVEQYKTARDSVKDKENIADRHERQADVARAKANQQFQLFTTSREAMTKLMEATGGLIGAEGQRKIGDAQELAKQAEAYLDNLRQMAQKYGEASSSSQESINAAIQSLSSLIQSLKGMTFSVGG